MNKKYTYLCIAFLWALSILLMKCNHAYEVEGLKYDHAAENQFNENEKNQLIKERDLAVFDVEVQKQNVISERKAKELLGEDVEKYKKLNSVVKAELKTVIKNISAKYQDTVFYMVDRVVREPVDTNLMLVPKRFIFNDTWVSINGIVKKKEVTIDSLGIINKFDVTIGWKKEKLLKRAKPVVELKSYNPYTTVPYVNNLVVKDKPKNIFFSKPAIFVYGIVAGILIK